MLARIVLVCVLAAALVSAEAGAEANLDEIEHIDEDVFSNGASPLEQAAERVAESEADIDADTEAVAHMVSESGAGARGEDATLYSFRAMKAASALAGSSVSEKTSETHAAAQRMLKSTSASSEELFTEINREQQILVAKRSLVKRQKQSIDESVDALKHLRTVVDENKNILRKNQGALRRASDDLLQLISKYQTKLKGSLVKEAKAPLKSRPHQRAATLKKDVKTGNKKDSTLSKVAQKKADEDNKAKKAAKATKKPAAKKAAAKPAKAAKKDAKKPVAKKAAAAAAKAKFSQVHDETAAEEEESDESEAEDKEEESEESEAEDKEEADEEDSDEEEADEEADEESEAEAEETEAESESSFVDAGVPSHASASAAALPGLAPQPPLYHEEDDSFSF